MRIIGTIFIALLTAGIAFFAWMHFSGDYDHLFGKEKQSIQGQPAFDFDMNQTRIVELESAEGLKAKFTFSALNGWHAETPWNDRAANIRALITYADNLTIQEVIPTEVASADSFGLGNERNHVTLKDGEGKILADFYIGLPSSWKVQLPNEKTLSSTVYIKNAQAGADAPTLLCSNPNEHIHALFKNKLVGLRNYRPIYSFDSPRTTSLNIRRNGTEIELTRGKSKWTVNKPLELSADQKKTLALIKNIHHFLNASELNHPSEVNLPESDNDLIELEIGYYHQKAKRILKIYPSTTKNNLTLATVSDRPNVVFEIPALPTQSNQFTYTSLPNSVNDIRSRRILKLRHEYLDTVIIKGRKKPPIRLSLLKNWFYIDPFQKKHIANKQALESFILALHEDNIISFVTDAATDLKKYGLDDPKITLFLKDKLNQPQKIRIGSSTTYKIKDTEFTGYFAKSESSDSVWLIKSDAVRLIPTNYWSWLPLEVLDCGITSVRELKIDRKGKPSLFIDYDFGGNYMTVSKGSAKDKLANPIVAGDISYNRVSYLVRSLTNLKAILRSNPLEPAARLALSDPILTINLVIEDPFSFELETITLKLAPTGDLRNSQFFYLKESKSGAIFQIDRKSFINLYSTIR